MRLRRAGEMIKGENQKEEMAKTLIMISDEEVEGFGPVLSTGPCPVWDGWRLWWSLKGC